jgi:hypothetical protein
VLRFLFIHRRNRPLAVPCAEPNVGPYNEAEGSDEAWYGSFPCMIEPSGDITSNAISAANLITPKTRLVILLSDQVICEKECLVP